MAEHNRENIYLYVVGAVLLAVVIALAVMVYQMNGKIDTLAQNQYAPAGSASEPAATEAQPQSAPPERQTPSDEEEAEWETYPPSQPNAWDPFAEMQRMQSQIDRIFGDAFNRFGQTPTFESLLAERPHSPRFDLVDEGGRYAVTVDVPGADESEINVELNGQTLTVNATTTQQQSESGESGNVIHQERRIGSFQRRIQLPDPVDGQSLNTRYENGVLTITLDKAT